LDQCQQLWNDIVRAGSDEDQAAHFVGSVVYVERGMYQISSVPQVLVIDGQQRLTTVSLLVAALATVIDERAQAGVVGDISRKKLENYYLFNAEEDGELHYKLLLTRGDKDTLIHLLERRDPPESPSKRLQDNHAFFLRQLRRPDVDPFVIYRGLDKLVIVDISLDRTKDNPQLIFESLNSTGLELSQADLIRNYVLMGLDVQEQTHLYNAYWYPMERRLSRAEYVPMFDRFMRDYLTVKSRSGAIPNIYDVYTSFKTYRTTQASSSIADIVEDIYRYAKLFIRLAYAEDPDQEIAATLADINALKVDVAYPFLLEVYDDYINDGLHRDDFLAILRLVESYVFRRAICGIPTNSLNKTFATLSREVDKSRYRESVEAAFARKDSYRRFPRDAEFVGALLVKDVYNFRSRNYLLRRLENFGRKEHVRLDEYTIEHVMPQNENLSAAWREELGPNWAEVRAKYLHTLGNLTLTGYNSELSDRPFAEKRQIPGGFDHSPLWLNASIAHRGRWTADEIERRAEELAKQAIKIWQAPRVDQGKEAVAPSAAGGQTISLSLEQTSYRQHLQGDMLALFEHLRKRILNLDASVREEFKQQYVAYKATTNFVDVVPRQARLQLLLNVRLEELDDPRGLCRDVTGLGHWGNGDVEIGLTSPDQLDDVMALIEQSFEKLREDGYA
jgi:uncharacterized protein with ParB-like and HNH nuclease domain/predicted transport protein